jgi:phenylpropionate dioxygenase-like ring-hydroxylating dioxygenase large terminal subunit
MLLLIAGIAWTLGEQAADPAPAPDTASPLDADNELWSIFTRHTETDLIVTTASSVTWSEEVGQDTIATKVNLRYLFTNQGDDPLVVQFVHAYLMSPGEPWDEFTHIANLTNHAPFGLTPGQSEGREFIGSAINRDTTLVVQVRYVSLDPNVTAQQETDVYLELPIRSAPVTPATPIATPVA